MLATYMKLDKFCSYHFPCSRTPVLSPDYDHDDVAVMNMYKDKK